jgi:hypothetical protein
MTALDDTDGIAGSGAPLGSCPPWCEKPREHDWEDEWDDGPFRTHTWRRAVGEHAIEVREFEVATASGTIRTREVILDVESPTQWDIATAELGLRRLSEAVAIAGDDRKRTNE